MIKRMHKFFLLFLGISCSINAINSQSEYIKELKSLPNYDTDTSKTSQQELLNVIQNAAQQYFKADNTSLKVSIQNNFAIIKNEKQQEAIVIFEIPQQEECYKPSEEEIKRIKELFTVDEGLIQGKYRIIKFRYNNEKLIPEDREQVIALLYLPYLTTEDLQEIDEESNNRHQSRISDCLNEDQRKALQENKSFLYSWYEAIKKTLKKVVKQEGIEGAAFVLTDSGPTKLKNLKIGDKIYSKDKSTGQESYHTVTYIDHVELERYIEISLNNEILQVAPDHQFYITSLNQWVSASTLKDNSEFRTLYGQTITDIKAVNKPLKAIRITVDSAHNFYITNQKLLVHNFEPTVVITLVNTVMSLADKIACGTLAVTLGLIAWEQNKKNHEARHKAQREITAINYQGVPVSIFHESARPTFTNYQETKASNSQPKSDNYQEKTRKNESHTNPSESTKKSANNNSSQSPKEPDKKGDNNKVTPPPIKRTNKTSLTTKEATEAAKKMGFQKTNYYSNGQPVFKKGNRYITPDADCHNGGVWKMADSVQNLGKKSTRMGTYDACLTRIGD